MSSESSVTTDSTFLSACEIARRIAAGEVSAAQVAEDHIRRIEAVNPALNAVVVPRFDLVREEAAAVDAARARGETLGPLAGVPVTVKEMFDMAGLPTTMGLTHLADHRAEVDSPLVARLRAAGAVVLGKTNVAQLAVLAETDNPLYGATSNPWNLERTSGGSSGGESAIIAAGGSALGLGSDGGGSIRGPCAWSGIHGFKPTSGRLSQLGHAITLNWHQEVVQPGPMARTVADLQLAMRVLSGGDVPGERAPFDPTTSPVPLGDPGAVALGSLRIGYYSDDGYLSASPALRRAVDESVAALRQAGATVEAFHPPDVHEAWRVFFSLLSADGWAAMKRASFRSKRDWRVRRILWINSAPTFMRRPLAFLLERLGRDFEAELFRMTPRRRLSVYRYRELREQHAQYRSRFLATMEKGRFDVLICPPTATPAPQRGSFFGSFFYNYAMLFNVLGMPAGVVAATRVRPGEESDRERTRDHVVRSAQAVEKDSAGLPVGVQVAARPWQDHQALAVMAALEAHFRQQNDYPERPPLD